MIKINLLRNMGLDAAQTGGMAAAGIVAVDYQKQAAMKIAAMLALPLALYMYESVHVSSLQEQLAEVQAKTNKVNQDKAAYGDAGPKVEKYTKEQAKIDEHLRTIRGLAKNRLREVKAFNVLQNDLPPQVWLEKVSLEESTVRVEGYSNNEEGVRTFFDKLENSPFFSGFQPQGQTQETVNGFRAIKFVVEFRVGREAPGE